MLAVASIAYCFTIKYLYLFLKRHLNEREAHCINFLMSGRGRVKEGHRVVGCASRIHLKHSLAPRGRVGHWVSVVVVTEQLEVI